MIFSNMTFELSAYLLEQLIPSDLPEIVLSGRSNVGKSSMINKLANRKSLARVSESPGKTASVNFYRCGGFRLVDLPGYGYARVSGAEKRKWAELVEGYFAQDRRIVLVVQLADARRAPTDDDRMMLDFLKEQGIPCILAYTKCDKLNKTEFARRSAEFEKESRGVPYLTFSAKTGAGVPELMKAVKMALSNRL